MPHVRSVVLVLQVKVEMNRGQDFSYSTQNVIAHGDPGAYIAFATMEYDLYMRGGNREQDANMFFTKYAVCVTLSFLNIVVVFVVVGDNTVWPVVRGLNREKVTNMITKYGACVTLSFLNLVVAILVVVVVTFVVVICCCCCCCCFCCCC